ncbi:LON peptidase N-terminal domain and RING finger protein 3-like [Heracleum sosnowskyi]|uniref:LON peptidase N-terminal domain and RING finger protein 3-like n=1 Tax=Heracleum sosnowskyi TaxID=360622 RepID=A0AAD8LYF1_9APIA|nr:LON peptidase N-terminal domain and RING finger protein 3-like [Heracleum sosnowskyi]
MQRSESLNHGSNSLKLRRPSMRVPTSDPDMDSPSARSRSGRLQKSISGLSDSAEIDMEESGLTPREDEEDEEGDGVGDGEEKDGGGSGKMSLMALLAETDREMGVESAYVMAEEEGEEVEEHEDPNDESGEYNNCCVCMVRHKGAAFTPCGHTFCSLTMISSIFRFVVILVTDSWYALLKEFRNNTLKTRPWISKLREGAYGKSSVPRNCGCGLWSNWENVRKLFVVGA